MIYLFVSQNMFNFAPQKGRRCSRSANENMFSLLSLNRIISPANKINDDNEAESESTHY